MQGALLGVVLQLTADAASLSRLALPASAKFRRQPRHTSTTDAWRANAWEKQLAFFWPGSTNKSEAS
jgi:hypothetical protein